MDLVLFFFFFSSRRRHTRCSRDWSSDVCSSDLWRLFGGPGTMFPNTSPLARQPRTIAAWHPRGPHQTEAWRWYLVDADAPAEVKDFLRQYYIRYSGPSGVTGQDDMEDWDYAPPASRGTIA